MLDYQTKGGNQYGAFMGRGSDLDSNTSDTLEIREVPIDQGGYDPGGAYWGTGTPLFCIWDANGHTRYLRASDASKAKAEFPDATFADPSGPTEDDISDCSQGMWNAPSGLRTETIRNGRVSPRLTPVVCRWTQITVRVTLRPTRWRACVRPVSALRPRTLKPSSRR